MIVAEWKPIPELVASLAGHRNVLLLGCATCVAECAAGGEREVESLAPLLRMALKKEGHDVSIATATVERQCEPEFLAPITAQAAGVDAIMSLACGIGMQLVAETFPEPSFYPGVNTTSLGIREEPGLWTLPLRRLRRLPPGRDLRPVRRGPVRQGPDERPLRRHPQGRPLRGERGYRLYLEAHRGTRPAERPVGETWRGPQAQGLVQLQARRSQENAAGGLAAMNIKAGTRLEKVLAAGQFALTVEVGPPAGPNPAEVKRKAEILKGLADGYNVTDNQTAVVRMSSIAALQDPVGPGLRTGDADDLPRPQPDRHPVRRAGSGRPGAQEHPGPFRRPPEGRGRRQAEGPPRVHERLRRGLHPAGGAF